MGADLRHHRRAASRARRVCHSLQRNLARRPARLSVIDGAACGCQWLRGSGLPRPESAAGRGEGTAFVIAILGDAAEAEPLLDVVAAPDGFAGRDVQQEARAIGQ